MSRLTKIARDERGSAYVIVLLVLVILSILGLSLTLVAQTEQQIGVNEQTINRSFYSADAGIAAAGGRALNTKDHRALRFTLNRTNPLPNLNVADEVLVTPFIAVAWSHCDWCPANEGNTDSFFRVTHAVNSTSRRVAWQGAATSDMPFGLVPRAQRTLGVMIEFQPQPEPLPDSLPTEARSNGIKF